MTVSLAVLIFLDLVANNLEPVALAAGSDDFIQDDEGVQEMRKNPVIIKTCGSLLNWIKASKPRMTRENYITSRV